MQYETKSIFMNKHVALYEQYLIEIVKQGLMKFITFAKYFTNEII